MSLISRLFSYRPEPGRQPLEDFFTEAFAIVLTRRPLIRARFLAHFLGVDVQEDAAAHVATQQAYARLPAHDKDSRIDLVIRVPSCDLVVFVENKIKAMEGPDQLKRYRDHLVAQPESERGLLYITNRFEAKAATQAGLGDGTHRFRHIRWPEIYRFLRPWSAQDELVNDVLAFMKEHGMALRNQFSPSDLSSFQGALDTLTMMDEVLDARFLAAMQAACPGTIKSHMDQRLLQWKRFRRYIAYWVNGQELEVLAGFWANLAPDGEPAEYPSVAVEVNVGPRNPQYREVIEAFKAFAHEPGRNEVWQVHEWNNGWVALRREMSLRQALAEDDHLVTAKSWLLEGLSDVEVLRGQTTTIAW